MPRIPHSVRNGRRYRVESKGTGDWLSLEMWRRKWRGLPARLSPGVRRVTTPGWERATMLERLAYDWYGKTGWHRKGGE